MSIGSDHYSLLEKSRNASQLKIDEIFCPKLDYKFPKIIIQKNNNNNSIT